jgi:hypothetical protein
VLQLVLPTTSRDHVEKFGKTRRSTYVKDGKSLTDRESIFEFWAKSMSQVVNHSSLLTDPDLQIQFDLDSFMKCLSYVDNSGKRRTAAPWPLGPGWRPRGASRHPDQQGDLINDLEKTSEFRATTIARLEDHERYMAQFIPHCVAHKKVSPLMDDGVEAVIASANSSDPALEEFSAATRESDQVSLTMTIPSTTRKKGKKATKGSEPEPQEAEDEENVNKSKPRREFLLLVDDKGNGAAIDAFNLKERQKSMRREEKKQQNRDGRADKIGNKGKGGKRKADGDGSRQRKIAKERIEDGELTNERFTPALMTRTTKTFRALDFLQRARRRRLPNPLPLRN